VAYEQVKTAINAKDLHIFGIIHLHFIQAVFHSVILLQNIAIVSYHDSVMLTKQIANQELALTKRQAAGKNGLRMVIK
jgi:hypothetical protein